MPASCWGFMEKPDVDQIEGLSPAISIDQRGWHRGILRSTVGTITEIYDYLRLLVGANRHRPIRPQRGLPIESQTVVADGRPGHGAAGRDAALSPRAGGARRARASTARNSPST